MTYDIKTCPIIISNPTIVISCHFLLYIMWLDICLHDDISCSAGCCFWFCFPLAYFSQSGRGRLTEALMLGEGGLALSWQKHPNKCLLHADTVACFKQTVLHLNCFGWPLALFGGSLSFGLATGVGSRYTLGKSPACDLRSVLCSQFAYQIKHANVCIIEFKQIWETQSQTYIDMSKTLQQDRN